ncbi:MAG: hypothetical protein JRJ85_04945 [Deltaproteobacteria bacterium]|nr:hypothetical protein [Deltaproteobacteria bacterium]
MTINIPRATLIVLNKYAAFGRLVHGLIHNLNGPLHNLGMDIEMMQLSLAGNTELDIREVEKIAKRLERMGIEFDHVAQMVRTTSMRLNPDETFDSFTSVKHFLEQELDFLNANLYFKHHVQTHLDLDEKLPGVTTLPEGITLSLGWFLQAVVEELEARKIEILGLKADAKSSSVKLDVTAKGRPLSDGFMEDLMCDPDSSQVVREEKNIGIRLAAGVMRSLGVDITGKNSADQSIIRLTIPFN